MSEEITKIVIKKDWLLDKDFPNKRMVQIHILKVINGQRYCVVQSGSDTGYPNLRQMEPTDGSTPFVTLNWEVVKKIVVEANKLMQLDLQEVLKN